MEYIEYSIRIFHKLFDHYYLKKKGKKVKKEKNLRP